MLIEEIDRLRFEPPQRALDGLPDMPGPAVAFGADLLSALDAEAELGRDRHLIAPALERAPDQFLVGEGAIALGRV